MFQDANPAPGQRAFVAVFDKKTGKIYFTNDEGQTFVVQAGRKFNLLHINELGARTLVEDRRH